MLLLGVSGSLRRDSHNTALVPAALELAPPGVAVERFEGLALVPPFNADDEPGDGHAGRVAWRCAIARADAVLFATPEYNSSIPGQLKNAVDWASRPPGRSVLQGKPVAVIGASTGDYGALWAQAELRKGSAGPARGWPRWSWPFPARTSSSPAGKPGSRCAAGSRPPSATYSPRWQRPPRRPDLREPALEVRASG